MDFVRARTQEQITSRQEEIIRACDVLFSQDGYDGVNFKAISEMTSFQRSTIYTYYKTKDEVLLDLLTQEMLCWQELLAEKTESTPAMTKEQFSTFLTELLLSNDKMLQLFSILFTFLEHNSSKEKLINFKKEVVKVLGTVAASVDKYFPSAAPESKEIFVHAFFAYILGLYPMSHLTEKQQEAIQQSGVDYIAPDFRYMCYHGILLLLADL